MKKLVWLILGVLWIHGAFAMKVQSIYEAQVLVRSQAELEREQGIQQAFIQTLSKLSGSTKVIQNPVIKAAVPGAKNQVEEFEYIASGRSDTPFFLKVQFDSKAMKKLLRQAEEPIWDENRPLILVWLSVENSGQVSEMIDNQSTSEYALLLKKEAAQRGLPLLLPMMDIAELNTVSAADIREKSLSALQKASQRYHADGLLIGNIESKGKILTGHWKLSLGPESWNWDMSSDSVSSLMQLLGDKLVNTLAARYASVQTEKQSSSFILVVKGVSQQEDFENLLRLIKQISFIKQMEIADVQGDEVVLHLEIQGAEKAFMQEASVGKHLQLQIEKENELTYLWMR